MDPKEAEMLRRMYPNHIPLKVAAKYLGVSPRQLSKLIAEEREPFKHLGGNIGTKQKYVRVYTERLIAYKNGTLHYAKSRGEDFPVEIERKHIR